MRKLDNRKLAFVLFLASIAPAGAQVSEFAGADTELNEAALESTNPQDIPGRDKGPRVPPPAQPEAAETPALPREWFGGTDWWRWNRATGDWAGARTWLEDRGISIEASVTVDWLGVWDGGVAGGAATRRLFDANLTLDLANLVSLSGGTIFLDFYTTAAGPNTGDAGDFSGVSNIETDPGVTQIAELWWEQWLGEWLRFKVGKIEGNSEFAFINAAAEAINSAPGVSPTVFAIPTYPDPATGIVAFVYPDEHWSLGAGFFDGALAVDGVPTGRRGPASFFNDDDSDDWFLIAEAAYAWSDTGRIAAGGWRHTGDFTTFDESEQSGTFGIYASVEDRVWGPAADAADPRGIYLYGQFGWTEDDVAEATLHLAAGLNWIGPCACRPDDAAGAYFSWLDLNDDAGFPDDEFRVEVYYRFQVTPFLSIKPDMQWILNPAGGSEADDALVGGIRVELGL